MPTEAILKPIWKWQLTIPLSWRRYLWIDNKEVRAFLRWGQIIIEPLNPKEVDRDVKKISINDLNPETQKSIIQSRKDYKQWNKSKFMSANEVRNDIL